MSQLFPSKILADIHDEANDALRVELVNPAAEWSTTEVDTGRKDANGNTIYRKVVSGLLPNSTSGTIAHGITNLNVAEGAHLLITGTVSDGTDVEPIGLAANVTAVGIDTTNVNVTTGADLSSATGVICLEYTKTA